MSRTDDRLPLDIDITVGDGLRELLSWSLGLLRRQGSAALTPPPEAVHRFRVGVRRLRSVLSAFAEALPDRERRVLGDRLSAVAQRYGPVRDWDVFLAETVAPLRQSLPDETALAELEETALLARRQMLPPGDTLKSCLADVEAAVDAASWLRRPPSDLAALWDAPLRDHAQRLLDSHHRRLRKRVKQADLADAASFHQLRIRVKKLRYPADLLCPLFDAEAAEDYLERLIALQHLMGSMNDALIARGLLREADPPLPARFLVAGWIAREIESCRDRFPGRARAFRRATPFWEDVS